MKFPTSPRPESVTDRSGTRFALEHPYFTGSEIVSTDGKAIIVLSVEADPGDLPGYVPSAALSVARREGKPLNLSDPDEVWIGDRGWKRPKATFPDWKQAIPAPGSFRVRFSVEVLRSVLVGIGGEHVTFSFSLANPGHPVSVEGDEATGAVMPARLLEGGAQ